MNTSTNLRTLAVLAVGICLVLPALSAPVVNSKIYIVRNLKTATEKDFLIGVEIVTNEQGEEALGGVFGIVPKFWDEFFSTLIPANKIVEEVSIEEAPVAGLYEMLKYRPELYSDFLPVLLSKSSPKTVAETLSVDLFRTLTPEAEKKISPADLAELTKLYGQ